VVQRRGWARQIGLSNVTVDLLTEAERLLDGAVPISSVQNRLNVFDTQSVVSEVVRFCESRSIAFLAHSPVGGHHGVARLRASEHVRQMAQRNSISPEQLALSALLQLSPCIIPIPGASKVESIRSSVAATSVQLKPVDREAALALFHIDRRTSAEGC
jgi:aryl-alcohol dehydrogenase-like predicted oxidoreductase